MDTNLKMESGEELLDLYGICFSDDDCIEIVEEVGESMAKVIKFSGYLVDPNGCYGHDDIEYVLDRYLDDAVLKSLKIEEVDIGEWYDNHPLNYIDCGVEECEKYFDCGV